MRAEPWIADRHHLEIIKKKKDQISIWKRINYARVSLLIFPHDLICHFKKEIMSNWKDYNTTFNLALRRAWFEKEVKETETQVKKGEFSCDMHNIYNIYM